MKKTIKIVLIIMCVLLILWIGTIVNAAILTALHFDEFTDFEAIGFDYMHPWEGTPKIRVITYTNKYATVYFCAPTGGEKVKFVKTDSGWQFYEEVALWSTGGSADEYFCWPYFKNWMF